jgi:Histidine kinase-, DNA gyrase B-, and HSP90-like ATPase
MPTSRAFESKTLPLEVANTGFMLDRLGKDCAPLQFLRELTQNAIEAVLRKPEPVGEIIWDVDWLTYELDDGLYKLSVVDNGDGMTGEELVHYINHLSASGQAQSHYTNFGVGAKIAAATRNHAGLIYLSWKDGKGSMVHLWRDPGTGDYGLQLLERPEGYGHWVQIEDAVKPDIIRKNGTKVLLYGNSAEENTMSAPAGAASPSRWITRYLNTRYFQFPEGITVKAREGWEYDRKDTDRNVLRTITGQKRYLDQHAQESGRLPLSNASAGWWILRKEGALTQNSGSIASAGHCAALYKNELYEMTAGRTSTAALQMFGVIFGYQQVVIYVEPVLNAELDITTDTARTRLLINSQPLPWADWAAEFRENMPDAITAHMESAAAASEASDHKDAIKERLKQIEELFRFSRYRPSARGPLLIDPNAQTTGGKPLTRQSTDQGGRPTSSRSAGGRGGSVYSLFLAQTGITGTEVKPDLFPDVRWISLAEGTREAPDLEDRAAKYIPSSNTLLINADFRVFTDMVKRWVTHYAGTPGGTAKVVEEVVREWFEQSLVEAVISSNGLRGSKEWTDDQIDKLLSEEGLTAVVLPRWHIEQSIKRSLGTRLGSLKAKAS